MQTDEAMKNILEVLRHVHHEELDRAIIEVLAEKRKKNKAARCDYYYESIDAVSKWLKGGGPPRPPSSRNPLVEIA